MRHSPSQALSYGTFEIRMGLCHHVKTLPDLCNMTVEINRALYINWLRGALILGFLWYKRIYVNTVS